MHARQTGVTLMGLLVGSFVLVLVALLAMRLVPAYIEYFTVKKAVVGIAKELAGREGSVSDVRRAFENRTVIDDIKAVKSTDLVVTNRRAGKQVYYQLNRDTITRPNGDGGLVIAAGSTELMLRTVPMRREPVHYHAAVG